VIAVLKSELVEKVEVETNRTKRGKKTQKDEFSGLFAFSHFLSFLFPLSSENQFVVPPLGGRIRRKSIP
jgi:hypothetical protein